MAAAKKDAAPKIMDIKPGKNAPSSSSRPLIVSNGPVLAHDPMMAVPQADVPAPEPHTAKVITPIEADAEPAATAPELTEAAKVAPKPENPNIHIELPTKRSKAASAPTASAEAQSLAKGSDDEEKPSGEPAHVSADVPTGEADAAEPVARASTAGGSTKVNIKPPSEAESTEEKPGNEDAVSNDAPEDTETAEGDVDGRQAAIDNAAEEARKTREAELEQLATSGKYALPIKPAKQGKSFFKGLLIVLLVLALAAVVVDGLLDAGLIHIGNFKAPTDFFDDGPAAKAAASNTSTKTQSSASASKKKAAVTGTESQTTESTATATASMVTLAKKNAQTIADALAAFLKQNGSYPTALTATGLNLPEGTLTAPARVTYAYVPSPDGCDGTTDGTPCDGYTLTITNTADNAVIETLKSPTSTNS